MPLYRPADLQVDEIYKLTEIVESIEISEGNYYLVSVEFAGRPFLDFAKTKSGKADVFLVETQHSLAIRRSEEHLGMITSGKFTCLREALRGTILLS